MARRSLPRKVSYFEPVLPRLSRNTIIESTFDASAPASAARMSRLRVPGQAAAGHSVSSGQAGGGVEVEFPAKNLQQVTQLPQLPDI
jgi:hypothetical protein